VSCGQVTQPILSPPIRANLAPLRVPAFGRLLFSYTTNSIGDYVGLVALAVLVYGETGDPLATTALFIAAQFLPAFLAPMLTAKADQQSLRRVLPAIYATEAVVFGVLALLAGSFSLAPVLALALLDGVLMLSAGCPAAPSTASCSQKACSGRETGCSTSGSRRRASAARRWAVCSSTCSASRRRCSSTPRRSP